MLITNKRCITTFSPTSHQVAFGSKAKLLDASFSTTATLSLLNYATDDELSLKTTPVVAKLSALHFAHDHILCATEEGHALLLDDQLQILHETKAMTAATCADYCEAKRLAAVGGTGLRFYALDQMAEFGCTVAGVDFNDVRSIAFNRIPHILCVLNGRHIIIADLRTKRAVLDLDTATRVPGVLSGKAEFRGNTEIIFSTERIYTHDLLNDRTVEVNKNEKSNRSGFVQLKDSGLICYGDGVIEELQLQPEFRKIAFATIEADDVSVSPYHCDLMAVGNANGVEIMSRATVMNGSVERNNFCRVILVKSKVAKIVELFNGKIVFLSNKLKEKESFFSAVIKSIDDTNEIRKVLIKNRETIIKKSLDDVECEICGNCIKKEQEKVDGTNDEIETEKSIVGDLTESYLKERTDKIHINYSDELIRAIVNNDIDEALRLGVDRSVPASLAIAIKYGLSVDSFKDALSFFLCGKIDVSIVCDRAWIDLLIFLCGLPLIEFRKQAEFLSKGCSFRKSLINLLICDYSSFFSSRAVKKPTNVFEYLSFIDDYHLIYSDAYAVKYNIESPEMSEFLKYTGCDKIPVSCGNFDMVESFKSLQVENNPNENVGTDNGIGTNSKPFRNGGSENENLKKDNGYHFTPTKAYDSPCENDFKQPFNEKINLNPEKINSLSPPTTSFATPPLNTPVLNNPVYGRVNPMQSFAANVSNPDLSSFKSYGQSYGTKNLSTSNLNLKHQIPSPAVSHQTQNPGFANLQHSAQTNSPINSNFASPSINPPKMGECFLNPQQSVPNTPQSLPNVAHNYSNIKQGLPLKSVLPNNLSTPNLNQQGGAAQNFPSPSGNSLYQQTGGYGTGQSFEKLAPKSFVPQTFGQGPILNPNTVCSMPSNSSMTQCDPSKVEFIVSKIDFLKNKASTKTSLILRSKTASALSRLVHFDSNLLTGDLVEAMIPFFTLIDNTQERDRVLAQCSIECDKVVRAFAGTGSVEVWLPAVFMLVQVVMSQ